MWSFFWLYTCTSSSFLSLLLRLSLAHLSWPSLTLILWLTSWISMPIFYCPIRIGSTQRVITSRRNFTFPFIYCFRLVSRRSRFSPSDSCLIYTSFFFPFALFLLLSFLFIPLFWFWLLNEIEYFIHAHFIDLWARTSRLIFLNHHFLVDGMLMLVYGWGTLSDRSLILSLSSLRSLISFMIPLI